MQTFTGFEYLLIDAANQYGHDKMLFDDRITWARNNLNNLENLINKAETKPLFIKAVMAIRKAQANKPTGHLVGFDAVCSGMQIMSAITGCVAGATATGLVDQNRRADAYSSVTECMNNILPSVKPISRSNAKRAVMTSFYGSKATPKEVFGEDSIELKTFYQAMNIVAPGAWELLQILLASWQPFALKHSWKLPDGYDAVVKVMEKKVARIEIDELAHSSFTYQYYENQGTEKGLSNVANVVHSIDAYVLRCIHRRCNYDPVVIEAAREDLLTTKRFYEYGGLPRQPVDYSSKVGYYIEQWKRSGIVDVVILPHLVYGPGINSLPIEMIDKLLLIIEGMSKYEPFEVVTIHDEFKCHPNNMNYLRYQYKEILADLADSNIIDDILTQIHGFPGSFKKLSPNLGDIIRLSNYALS